MRDDIERDRRPVLALALAFAGIVAALVALVAGHGWTACVLLVDAGAIWLFGASLEGRLGRPWFVLLVVSGAAGAIALALAGGSDEHLVAAGATGAAFEAVVIHLLRLPGARILTIRVLPLAAGIIEVPAVLWAGLWALAVVVLAALGAFGS